jgi:hypothetical protein
MTVGGVVTWAAFLVVFTGLALIGVGRWRTRDPVIALRRMSWGGVLFVVGSGLLCVGVLGGDESVPVNGFRIGFVVVLSAAMIWRVSEWREALRGPVRSPDEDRGDVDEDKS